MYPNELRSLDVLFDRKIFRIPDYQRGYAWGNAQLIDFWEDLINLPDEHRHYTGMISLKQVSGDDLKRYQDEGWLLKNSYHVYSVVDGQQRLTTFVILINAILRFYETELPEEKLINDKSIEEIRKHYLYTTQANTEVNNVVTYKFGYDVDNPSYDFFKVRILNNDHETDVDDSFYTYNLLNAQRFFEQKLQELYKEYGEQKIVEVLGELFVKLTQQMCFNEYLINDDFDVFVTFETMNNRGKKLSNLELLKNRLIYLSTVFPHRENDDSLIRLRRDINGAWQEVYQNLGQNKDRMLLDDDFLRAHWLAYFGYGSHKKHDYADFLLKKFFVKQRVFSKVVADVDSEETREVRTDFTDDETDTEEDEGNVDLSRKKLKAQDISNYVNSLKELAPVWYKINYPDDSGWSQEIVNWLQRLNRIQSANFRPLTLVIMANRELTEEEKVAYLAAVEKFVFFNFGLSGYQTSFRRNTFASLAHTLYQSKDVRKDLAKVMEALKNIDCLKETDEGMVLDVSVILPHFNRLFQNYGGYYSWSLLHYFLYEYESWLMAGRGAPHKTLSEDFFAVGTKDRVSIEHILPQNPEKSDHGKGSWNVMLKGVGAQKRKVLTGSLGNLLALSEARNKRFQNDRFSDKCNGRAETDSSKGYSGYKDGCLSETEVAAAVNDKGEPWWDQHRILARGREMLDFMAEYWGFRFENDTDKVKMLYLEFMEEKPEETERT